METKAILRCLTLMVILAAAGFGEPDAAASNAAGVAPSANRLSWTDLPDGEAVPEGETDAIEKNGSEVAMPDTDALSENRKADGNNAADKPSVSETATRTEPEAERPETSVPGTEREPPPMDGVKETSYADWFMMDADVAADWRVIPVPGDPNEALIIPRERTVKAAEKADGDDEILVLFPKRSSAYDTAMATILNVFHGKAIPARFRLKNFLGKSDLGMAALADAEAGGIDLIFSMGSASTDFIVRHYTGGDIPVVSVCSKDPVLLGQIGGYDIGSGTNIAFTSLNVPVELQMTYLKELMPGLRNIVVLYARQNRSAVVTQFEPLREIAVEQKLRVLDVVVEERLSARAELAEKIPLVVESLVNSGQKDKSIFWITGSTSVFREIETINRYAGGIPVLSVVPDVVTSGDDSAVLSIGVSFESNAYIAAVYGVKILSGETAAGDLTVGVVSPPDIAVNFKRAREIGLKIPFNFFELASYVYDHEGRAVRVKGQRVKQEDEIEAF